MQDQCVGVDVSKQHLDWVVGENGSVARPANTPSGVRRLVAAVRKLPIELIVVESTGGYERRLTVALSEANLPVVLVNPGGFGGPEKVSGSLRSPIRSTHGFSHSTENGLAP
jgi:transposase